jgi:hypothetical protein
MPRNRVNINATKIGFNGRSIKPSPDPTAIVTNPWNTITLVFTAQNDSTLYVDDIYRSLADSIGLPVSPEQLGSLVVNFRILQYRCWETLGNALQVTANELTSDDHETLRIINTQTDEPGRNHWARLGYIWPKSHQNKVMDVSADATVSSPILTARTSTAGQILLHINILWKTTKTLTEPTTRFQKKTFNRFSPQVDDFLGQSTQQHVQKPAENLGYFHYFQTQTEDCVDGNTIVEASTFMYKEQNEDSQEES